MARAAAARAAASARAATAAVGISASFFFCRYFINKMKVLLMKRHEPHICVLRRAHKTVLSTSAPLNSSGLCYAP